jgi:hypothetical protein
MHDRDAGLRRQGRGQPNDQSLGEFNSVGLGRPILLDPARDLTLEEIARTTECRKAGGLRVDPVKRRKRIEHAVINARASALGQLGKRAVGEVRTLDQGHQIEGRADHRLVFAQRKHAGHWKAEWVQRGEDAIFALYGVGRRQQIPEGLATKHVGAARRIEPIRRIRLSALEFRQGNRPLKTRDVLFEPGGERGGVEVGSSRTRGGIRGRGHWRAA